MEYKSAIPETVVFFTRKQKNKINVDRYKIREEQVKKANYKEDCFAQKKRKKQIELCEHIYR